MDPNREIRPFRVAPRRLRGPLPVRCWRRFRGALPESVTSVFRELSEHGAAMARPKAGGPETTALETIARALRVFSLPVASCRERLAEARRARENWGTLRLNNFYRLR